MAKWKEQQRKINKYVRDMNKNLQEDEKWKGRFKIRQIGTPLWTEFSDHSGGILAVWLRIVDFKTLTCLDWPTDNYTLKCSNGFALWKVVNDFVCACTKGEP